MPPLSKDSALALSCPKVIDSIPGDDNQKTVFITNIKITGLNSNSVKDIGQHIIDLAQTNTSVKPVTFGSIGDFSICVRKDSLAGNNIFTLTANGQYRHNNGIIDTTYPLTAVQQFEHSLKNISDIHLRNSNRLGALQTERQHLFQIKDKPWEKENILVGKKKELQELTYKITSLLKEKTKNNTHSERQDLSVNI